jgi:hypothetical protein
MRVKRVYKKPDIYAPVGLHLAELKDIRYARKPDGNIIYDQSGVHPIVKLKIGLDTSAGKEDIIFNVGTTPNVEWIWKNLRGALKIKSDEKKNVLEAIGEKFYVIVAGKAKLDATGVVLDDKGQVTYSSKELRMKFFQYNENGFKPILEGDPERRDGIPAGDFLLNEVDIKEYLKLNTPSDEF